MELQKASTWKRMSAWMFDGILLAILAMLFAFLLSFLLGYNRYSDLVDEAQAKYEAQFGIQFEISEDEYWALPEQDRNTYDAALEAYYADKEAMHAYGMVTNLSMVIISISVLLAVTALEFVVPMLFKNGQTLGKKIFGIALIRIDGVRMSTMQMFVRTLLGKYVVGLMIPIYLVLMLYWNIMDIVGLAVLAGLPLVQLGCLCFTRNKVGLADLMAGTAPVELNSQRIFHSTEDLIAYTKKVHAEKAARQDY